MTLKQILLLFFKGGIVGATMLVPGVSGGSMAMILGVYDKIIRATSSLFKNMRLSLPILISFSMGAGLGILLFAKSILFLIDNYPMSSLYFFLGAIMGGVPLILKKARIDLWRAKYSIFPIFGVLCVIGLGYLPTDLLSFDSANSWLSWLVIGIAGMITAVALVLPGISVSYMLLVMGLYDETIKAVSTFDLSFLLPLGLAVLIGVLLTTHILEWAMKRYPQGTFLMILGFILASLREVFPGVPTGMDLLWSAITFAMGFTSIYLLSQFASGEK